MGQRRHVFKVVDGLDQNKLDETSDYASLPGVVLVDREIKMGTIAMDDSMEIGCLIFFHFTEEQKLPEPL